MNQLTVEKVSSIKLACKTNAEVTVALKPKPGTRKGMGCNHSFLEFSLVTFFVSRQRK
jgi:hypothetical protein